MTLMKNTTKPFASGRLNLYADAKPKQRKPLTPSQAKGRVRAKLARLARRLQR